MRSDSESYMILKTHGAVPLRGGRLLIEADYHPSDGGPGLLALRLEDQETGDSVDGLIRLDPWLRDEYRLIEFGAGTCLLVCGEQAVVSIDVASLVLRSSVILEYDEVNTLDVPWHAEPPRGGLLVVATQRRVWCLDERGTMRWLWSCATSEQARLISGPPTLTDKRVRVALWTARGDIAVEIQLEDGLPSSPASG